MDYGEFNPLRKGRDVSTREIKVGTVSGISLMCYERREGERKGEVLVSMGEGERLSWVPA